MKTPTGRRCPYCGATGEEDSAVELLMKLEQCNNCRVDIELKGQWTGDGWHAVQRFKERQGKERKP